MPDINKTTDVKLKLLSVFLFFYRCNAHSDICTVHSPTNVLSYLTRCHNPTDNI